MAKRGRKPKKAYDGERIRLQAWVDIELSDKLDALALKMGKTRNEMMVLLLGAAIEDNKWIIDLITSKYFKPVIDVVEGWHRDDKGLSAT